MPLSYLSVTEIDSLNFKGKLTKRFYPDMSACGGTLNGFYYEGNLVLINAKYSGELGYTQKTMYLNNSEFIKIIYHEHFPEMEKYHKKYPLEKYDFDPQKVTFADTIYELILGKNIEFKKTYRDKILTREIDTALVEKLIKCGEQMKKELKSIRETPVK